MIALSVLGLYAAVIAYLSSRKRPGVFTWHMFAGLHMCRFHLVERGGERVNVWNYLPHTHLSMSRGEMRLFLSFLRHVHDVHADGSVRCYDGMTTRDLEVKDSHVVD
jgi:hypothetical protein